MVGGDAGAPVGDPLRSADWIVSTFYDLRRLRGPQINTAHQIRDAYNGQIALPLPELNRNEQAAVANLIRQGINQNAMRTASTLPSLFCPPTRPGIKKAEDEAMSRRKVFAGWWEMNDFKKKQYRRCRQFIGYASTPVVIRPDFKREIPCWYPMDPLGTFPAPCADPDDMEPEFCIFSYRRAAGWLKANYDVTRLEGMSKAVPGDQFDMLEFVDADEHVLVVLGRSADMAPASGYPSEYHGDRFTELLRLPNLAGICTAVVPGRVTLDRPQGQFDGMLPLFIKRARLAALEEIAIEKGVFENEWFVEDAAGNGQIVTDANGREGIVGHVKGGKIEWHSINPGYKTDTALDRMERQERVEGTIPAEFAGESASNVRTDRRGNSILSATIDYSIAETHDLLAESYRKEFHRAVAVAKTSFGDGPKSFYVSWKGATGSVTYVPNKLFADTDEVLVRWSMPGSDVNSLTVGGGQRVGMGTLSKRGFMELDPLVDDVEEEHDRIIGESLEAAVLSSLQQQAAAGAIPPADLARIMQLVSTNDVELAEAISRVHEEAQARQSTTVDPAVPGSPDAQPGLAQAGQGAEAGTIAPTQNEQGLAALMSTLRAPARVGQLG